MSYILLHLQLYILISLFICTASGYPNASTGKFERDESVKVSVKNELSVGGRLHERFSAKAAKTDLVKRYIMTRIFNRMDSKNDGFITFDELKRWIKHVTAVSARREALESWNRIIKVDFSRMSWSEYVLQTYGWNEETIVGMFGDFGAVLHQEKRRWIAADLNTDGKLDFEEYIGFLYPQSNEHMREALIAEALETVDRNGDKAISEEEYLKEVQSRYPPSAYQDQNGRDWIKLERFQFKHYLDWNKDGFMTGQEIGSWIMPLDYDEAEAETQYLIEHLDANRDHVLSKKEIMKNLDAFIQSQVTNYGKALDYYSEL